MKAKNSKIANPLLTKNKKKLEDCHQFFILSIFYPLTEYIVVGAYFLVLHTIQLAVWPVSVWYRHWLVDISGWYFCSISLAGTLFWNLVGLFLCKNPWELFVSSKRGGLILKKGSKAPLFLKEKGALVKFLIPKCKQSFPLVSVGTIPRKYQPISNENTNSVCNSTIFHLVTWYYYLISWAGSCTNHQKHHQKQSLGSPKHNPHIRTYRWILSMYLC